jgi:dTDP-4-dehydrorhamnose 3,5-epimerase
MKVERTAIADVLVLEPRVYGDARGFFLETWNAREFEQLGVKGPFVQDNHSRSARNVLRGLHYQLLQPQGKLVRATVGEVWDVAVDLRRSSPSFGRHVATRLDAVSHRMMWVPPGFAHGFLVLSDFAEVQYKVTDYYAPQHERALLWNDPALGIEWPLSGAPVISDRDRIGALLADTETFG